MKSADDREEILFHETLQRPKGPEREAFLDQACAGNQALRSRLRDLLQAYESPDPFLDPLVAPPDKTVIVSTPLTEKPGDRIGRYQLLQQIGEGGCGVVYMAEQEEPIRRRVALKVIKLGMDTKQVIARFEAERQALALMDHPNIAKVLDAGATDTGRPFFVMELVRGIKITDYCDQNNLSTDQRLDLFVQICHAIQHAHQKGIIHRDIKPSNILVTVQDDKPSPKIIDFGIAKATSGQWLTAKTVFTAFEQFIGTPAYMSPEQAEMSTLDIDPRSDIYALGVLLYELLTGQTPFDQKELVAAGLNEMRRIIREEEPLRPSTRISTLAAADQSAMAKRRNSEPPRLIHLVRGDLDWIVMKCLEKNRTRRYASARGLAEDVQNYLEDRPVIAVPPSWARHLAKLAGRRRKTLLAVGLGLSSILALLFSLATWISLAPSELKKSGRLANDLPAASNALEVRVVSSKGGPISNAECRLIVGGYPTGAGGLPQPPAAENQLVRNTDQAGLVSFRHQGLKINTRHALYVSRAGYCGASRFPELSEMHENALTLVLFEKKRVTLRYAYQATDALNLTGPTVNTGEITLEPMEEGSYRPPARAFFSFKQNKYVGSSGVLDIGIAADERNGTVLFGGCEGRFDHFTDLGRIPFDDVVLVDTNKLDRRRENTPMKEGHTYIYESNIYPPDQRTQWTGFGVHYGKVLVERIESLPSGGLP